MTSKLIWNCLLVLAFCGCGRNGYQQRGGEWHWGYRDGNGHHLKNLNADKASFRFLAGALYAKDSNHVFFEGEILPQADAASFEVMSDGLFGRDAYRVFLHGYIIAEANPKTFVIIAGLFGKDDRKIYCGTVPMNVENIDSFEIVRQGGSIHTMSEDAAALSFGPEYAKNKISEYAVAFVPMAFSRDGKNYYFGPARIADADYDSFEILSDYKSKDKNCTFFNAFPSESLPERRKNIFGIPANNN